jgi:hypothetical protein
MRLLSATDSQVWRWGLSPANALVFIRVARRHDTAGARGRVQQHHRGRFGFAPSSIQMRIAPAPIVKMAIWFPKRSTKLVSAI